MRQWAFEWRSIMDETKVVCSSFPYHFVDARIAPKRRVCQVNQMQNDVYRSAYLKTAGFCCASLGIDVVTCGVSFGRLRSVEPWDGGCQTCRTPALAFRVP